MMKTLVVCAISWWMGLCAAVLALDFTMVPMRLDIAGNKVAKIIIENDAPKPKLFEVEVVEIVPRKDAFGFREKKTADIKVSAQYAAVPARSSSPVPITLRFVKQSLLHERAFRVKVSEKKKKTKTDAMFEVRTVIADRLDVTSSKFRPVKAARIMKAEKVKDKNGSDKLKLTFENTGKTPVRFGNKKIILESNGSKVSLKRRDITRKALTFYPNHTAIAMLDWPDALPKSDTLKISLSKK